MIQHYLKIAFRNMSKQKIYSAVNIGGFAIGIAACVLITLYIKNELSYDRDNPNKEQVFRIIGEAKQNGEVHSGVSFPPPMARALLNDFPEVINAGRTMSSELFGGANNQVRRLDQTIDNYEQGFCFADTSILDILNIRMVYGDRTYALSEPNSVVLCKSMADKYFPNQNPVGKTLVFNNNTKNLIKIGGVMEDFPANSHLQYKGFISLAGVKLWDGEQEKWTSSNYQIYLQLRPGVHIEEFDRKITADVLDKYMIPALKGDGKKNAAEIFKGARLYLQPLTDIHLQSYSIQEDNVKHGDIRFIWMFAAIALFILVLACINFLNLSTARSANRAKEVGLRKVVGSSRANLIRQFLTESILYSSLSFIAGLLTAIAILPVFNKIASTHLSMPWSQWWMFPAIMVSAILIGLLAGLYPAFYLSYFKPINTLKGKLSLGSKNAGLRSTLVVFQFTISIILLISTSVIYKQMQYILNSSIGFDKDEVVMIQGADALRDHTTSFKNELLRSPLIRNVSVSDFLPVEGTKRNGNPYYKEGKQQTDNSIQTQRWVVDENYIPTLGMKLLAGRNFTQEMHTDSAATIINKAMADHLGFNNPIGKKITNGGEHLTIVGVVDNFYYESVKQQVNPLLLVLGNSNSIISVKVNATNVKSALAAINGVWKNFLPNQTLRYNFLDQSYASMYADVQRMEYIFTGFSLLAVIVASLGLFALAAFMGEQRSKEVSIRKVLGASATNIFGLLTQNFLKLIVIALLIAAPLAWLLMRQWLQDYTYRIAISWDIFAVAGMAVFLIALAAVCFQAIKSAIANPVQSLRSE